VSESIPSHTLQWFAIEAYPAAIKRGKVKTKTWTVITNTGKQADLESGLDEKKVQKPTHISARDFIHWLKPESHIGDDCLRSPFKL
jgi:hypothetical protein